jgi:hypothetical protein
VLLGSVTAAVDVELARHQWDEGRRALERTRRADSRRHARLAREIGVVTAGLTRRIGQVFTLAELATVYGEADRWILEELHEAFPDNPPTETATVADAAFDAYSRRASDYAP